MTNEKLAYPCLEELRRFAEIEGTEWGEAVRPFCEMYHVAHYLSDDFFDAYCTELRRLYQEMIEDTEIIKEERREIVKDKIYRQWKY